MRIVLNENTFNYKKNDGAKIRRNMTIKGEILFQSLL